MSTSELPSPLTELLAPPPVVAEKPAKPSRKERAAEDAPTRRQKAQAKRPAPQRATGKLGLVVGAEPRVDLLPPEVKAQQESHVMRRTLLLAVIAVILIAVAGSLGARVWAQQAADQQRSEQSRAATLLTQQRSFNDVVGTQSDIALAEAAQRVGDSTEVDWKSYLDQVQATLPADVTIKTIAVDSSSPTAAYAQPTAPLQGARVATITFSATSPDIPLVPEWLDALAKLPGYADATPGSVSYDQPTSTYTASVTMHVNSAVFDQRFAKEK